MIKKMLTLMSLTTIVVSLTGCVSKTEPATNETLTETEITETTTATETPSNEPYEYINKDKGFSFTLPAAWTFQENVFGSLVMFFAPQTEGDKTKENLGVSIVELTGKVDLKSYYELAKGILESKTNDFKIEKEEELTINGENAMKIIFKGSESETKFQREQVIVLKGTTVYVLVYTATQDTFNDFINDADTIINTFKVQ